VPIDLAAVGAFFSGIGAVLGGWWAMRRKARDDHDNCDERLAALREGFKMGKEP